MQRRLFATLALAAACVLVAGGTPAAPAAPARKGADLDRIAESWAKLALALGRHDPDYVDAFYGPPEWREAVEAERPGLRQIDERAALLIAELQTARSAADDADALRRRGLLRQLKALTTRVQMLSGARMKFDEESKALYDAVLPARPDTTYRATLARLEKMLPGHGPLGERYEAWRAAFVIPPGKVDTVFRAAVAEGRRRTLQHVKLPPEESFAIEYVTGKSWAGYNWYKGGYRSVIQINTDLPIHIDRALDLACHEGYPGHHVYNTLLEERLVKGRGWREFTLMPLFSPMALIAEGTAVYATRLAFTPEERLAYERDVLFPLAGLDARRAAEYTEVRELVDELKSARTEGTRRYLDGLVDRESAIEWAISHELRSRGQAERGIRFAEQYRSYAVNYSLGEDMVAHHVETLAGPDREKRWSVYLDLLGAPTLPSDLR